MIMRKTLSARIATLAVVLVVAGCASRPGNMPGPATGGQQSPPPPPTNNAPPQPPSGTTGQAPAVKPPPRTAAQISSPAVMSLLNTADTLARAGHMNRSAATLERALNLDPRNPFIYQQLAAVRLAEGQAGQAEEMARKSNSLAGNNPFVKADNWRLIAEARRAGGNSNGAQQASAQAANYHQAAGQYSSRSQ